MSGKKSPTQRSLEKLRSEGYTVAVVERYNSFTKRRHDLFGFIDVLAIRGGETLAVQTTSASNMSARAAKIAEADTTSAVRAAGWRIVVHGWIKRNPKSKRSYWECKEVDCS